MRRARNSTTCLRGGPAAGAVLSLVLVCLAGPAKGASLPTSPPSGSAPPTAGIATTAADTTWIETLVELRAGQIERRTVFAFEHQGEVLVPVVAVLDLVEIGSAVTRDGVVDAALKPTDLELSIDPRSLTAQRGNEQRTLEASRVGWREGELFCEAEVVAWLLGCDVYVDLTDLLVTFDPVDRLPLGRRWYRERARASLDRHEKPDPDLTFTDRTRWWRGAVLDWSATMPGPDNLEQSSTALNFGGNMLGGGLDLRYRTAFDGERSAQFDASWLRVWPNEQRFRQLRLGRTQSTSPRGLSMRGVAVSNSPFVRTVDFGQTMLRGYLDPDWEVEVYRYGQLYDYRRTDERGYYEFLIPVDYGLNAVEIRAYGPHGETRVFERTLRVDFDRLPRGETEYGVSGGDCVDASCNGMYNVDTRHGLHERWTLRSGSDTYFRDGGSLVHPYAMLVGSPWTSLQLRTEWTYQASQAVRVGFEPSTAVRLGLEHERYSQRLAKPILTPRGERELSRATAFWKPLPSVGALFLRGDLTRRNGDVGERWRSVVGASHSFSGLRLTGDYIEEWSELGRGRLTQWSATASSVLRARWLRPLHHLYVRATALMTTRGWAGDEYSLRLGRRIAPGVRFEMGARWSDTSTGAEWSLGITDTGRDIHASSMVVRSPRGEISNLTAAEGSLLYNEGTGQIETRGLRSLGRGGIQGVVYVDANANGRHDAGEDVVPGVRLLVGDERVETDGYGRYAVWHLTPFEAAHIELVPASLKNPLLVPDFERAAAMVKPNGFQQVDLPLLPGAEVSGTVQVLGPRGVVPLGGVALRLRGERRGRVYDARTYSDGEFYVMPVPPGEYDVEVDTSYLERAGLRVRGPVRVTVPITASRLESVEVRVVLESR